MLKFKYETYSIIFYQTFCILSSANAYVGVIYPSYNYKRQRQRYQ